MEENRFIQLKANLAECCFISIPKKRRRAIWELSHYCPQNCPYCFTSSSKELSVNKDFLSRNKIKVINLFQSMDVEDVLLTGGEPLSVENEIIDILKILEKRGITYSISTIGKPVKYLETVCDLNPRRINLSFDPKSNNGIIPWKSSRKILEENLNILAQKKNPCQINCSNHKKQLYERIRIYEGIK